MKSPYAHASRTALALVAAAGILWLVAFVRPGAGEQPIPLLPAIGSAAEKIVAAPEPRRTKLKPASAPRRTIAVAAFVAAPAAPAAPVRHAAQPRHVAVQRPHRAHPRHPAAPAKHFTAAAPPAPVSSSAAPRGRAVGWHRKHDQAAAAPVTLPEHRHGRSHAKHDVTATGTKAHDNGKHQGHDHDHGGQGHGHGGKT